MQADIDRGAVVAPMPALGHGFLASDAAKFITGTTIEIDGGGSLLGDLWTIERPVEFGDESRR